MARTGGELLPGTFDLLLLKALSLGAMHGWGIAERIERLSGDVFNIQQGAVYPALQRLLRRGYVTTAWRMTDNSRRARYYSLTASGRTHLQHEVEWWQRSSLGVTRILRAATAES